MSRYCVPPYAKTHTPKGGTAIGVVLFFFTFPFLFQKNCSLAASQTYREQHTTCDLGSFPGALRSSRAKRITGSAPYPHSRTLLTALDSPRCTHIFLSRLPSFFFLYAFPLVLPDSPNENSFFLPRPKAHWTLRDPPSVLYLRYKMEGEPPCCRRYLPRRKTLARILSIVIVRTTTRDLNLATLTSSHPPARNLELTKRIKQTLLASRLYFYIRIKGSCERLLELWDIVLGTT